MSTCKSNQTIPRPKIALYFDLHSTYTYLAYYVLANHPIFKACEVEYMPVFLMGIIKFNGSAMPWTSKNKVSWFHLDWHRWSEQYSIPLPPGLPAKYPQEATTLQVQRLLTACHASLPTAIYLQVLRAVWRAFWVDKRAVQTPEVFTQVLQDVLSNPAQAEALLQQASSEETKARLHRHTEAAIQSGCPGLPWIKATRYVNDREESEYFWGFDHLGQVVEYIGLGKLAGPHL